MALNYGSRISRALLLVLAIGSLITGIWGGLLRLPLAVPLPTEHANWITFHGPLMVCGFLGTVIGLERAVGLRALWTYAAPVLTGLSAATIALGVLEPWPRWTLTAGSAVFAAVALRIITIQPAAHTWVMGGGALAWVVGNWLWALGWEIPQVVGWWMSFLLLIIVGERLELTRFQRPSRWARPWLISGLAVLVAGLGLALAFPTLGAHVTGLGLLGLTGWLVTFDIARRTVRQSGLPGFMAVCLLSGYAWLGLAGAVLLGAAPVQTGYLYDAALHSFFLGFVFSMIFGHAPVIFPSVLGLPISFRNSAYGPLVVLHLSVALRVSGDLFNWPDIRQWGGAGNALAIGVFLANMIFMLARSRSAANAPSG